ncbi:MAG: phage/plasmid primase, P4 family [Methanoculleus sp.]|jgi:P4 family phage/plasmid primase-like protien|nr:phage/plasmid primase, P4 family [Methanoculleus sp.]MDD4455421.1 phage/plasmid primase, P4 family [Candidatus Methanomethylophilaceae archaeon]
MHSYALATTPEVDRRVLQALADVLAEDRRAGDRGQEDFGQIIAGRSEPTAPTPAALVAALRQTLEGRIMGGERGNPIPIQTVERIPLDVLQRLEVAGARLVAPDAEDGGAPIQILHLQHLLRLAHAAATRIPPPPADDGTIQARVATPEESTRRERLDRLTEDLISETKGMIERGVRDEELIVLLARSGRGEFVRDVSLTHVLTTAHNDLNDLVERGTVTSDPSYWRYKFTPAAVAERLVTSYKDDITYVPEADVWRTWTGIIWADDEGGAQMTHLVKTTVLRLSAEMEASNLSDDVKMKIADKKISPLLGSGGITNVLKLASKDSRVRRRAEQFDADPLLFNLLDGTIDLRTGTRRFHRREDRITKLGGVIKGEDKGVRYDPNATCPRWMRCLNEWFVRDSETREVDPETIQAVRERAGYWLSGLTHAHEYVTWFSPEGRNGKGVMKNLLIAILGQYACTADTGTFVRRGEGSKGAARGDLAALHGKRLVFVSEPAEGDALDEEFLKKCTGDDVLSFRPPYGKANIEFKPQFKITLLANHTPTILAADSIWDRQRIILWKRRFEEHEQDFQLEEELMSELPGILNWMLDGFREFHARGRLSESQSMTDEKARYKASQRPHWVEYVEDRCVLRREVPQQYRQNIRIHKQSLFDDYLQWCAATSISSREQLGRNKFYSRLVNKFALDEGNETGVGRVIRGITTKVHFESILTYDDRRAMIQSGLDHRSLCKSE